MGVDLLQVCKEFYRNNSGDEGSLQQININRIKIEALPGRTNWPNIVPSNGQGESYQVQVERFDTSGAGSASTVSNTNTVEVFAQYKLDQDYIKGINQPLKVPLDGSLNKFGQSLDVNIGKRESAVKSVIPLSVTAERPFASGQASERATISVETPRCKGKFECPAKIRGPVIFPRNGGADQVEIVDIFEEMGLLRGPFSRNRNEVHFTVRGECTLQIGNRETVQYN